ncbi:hypothetical protein U1Q18_043852 [Sarracenia purpurea var. burkii]
MSSAIFKVSDAPNGAEAVDIVTLCPLEGLAPKLEAKLAGVLGSSWSSLIFGDDDKKVGEAPGDNFGDDDGQGIGVCKRGPENSIGGPAEPI